VVIDVAGGLQLPVDLGLVFTIGKEDHRSSIPIHRQLAGDIAVPKAICGFRGKAKRIPG
jgi:hypothetical protein